MPKTMQRVCIILSHELYVSLAVIGKPVANTVLQQWPTSVLSW